MRSPRLLSVVVSLMVSASAFARDTEISGRQAEAVALVVKAFKSLQGSKDERGMPVFGDLRHYSLLLRPHGKDFEVVFLPDDDATGGTGGATHYGYEVHYVISLKHLKILRRDFAR